MKIRIDKSMLDSSKTGDIELEAKVFAYFPATTTQNKSYYCIYKNTEEYNALWNEVTKDFKGTDDWSKKLEEVYAKQPELRDKLSRQGKYKVPKELLVISRGTGGHHGDLDIKYENVILAFHELGDYETFSKNDAAFHEEADVIAEDLEGKISFCKGNQKDLENIRVTISS
jgi:hypothetical protein